MHYSYTVPAGMIPSAFPCQAIAAAIRLGAVRRAEADSRWPIILRALKALRERGRRSIRIVDAGCGAGDLLIETVRRARALGFVAIEARGIDRDPALIAAARAAAQPGDDAAIGLAFETGDLCEALCEEAAFPADLVLYARPAGSDASLDKAATAAGRIALRAPGRAVRKLAA